MSLLSPLSNLTTLGFLNLNPMELLLIALLALLIFGKRLPEVGRSLGKGIVEFKKGLAGVEDDIKHPANGSSGANPQITRQQEPQALPPAQPQAYAQDPRPAAADQQHQPRA
ncbi:MAG: twin-arginine translocase TatA/TatE family subunit [Planctomycetota bacterium]|nr:twin-arginine translocase TatA/TatE family subunit [Planctomycetota bacterium]